MSDLLLRSALNHGKLRRLNRIFPQNGRCVAVPFDDSLISGPSNGLYDLQSKIRLVENAKPSAIISFFGVARLISDYDIPLILNLTASTTTGRHTQKVLISTVEQAVAAGAEAVAVHINFTSQYENDMLCNVERIKYHCEKLGVPLLVMAYPRSELIRNGEQIDQNYEEEKIASPDKYIEKVAHCVRIAFELGADIIKTQYTGTPDSFKHVINSAQGVPVLIAGGRMIDDEQVLTMVKGAMMAGASGVSIGRNVFDRLSSDKIVQAIKDIVFEDASVEQAKERLL